MYLVRLIYASKISSVFKPEDIESILKTARRLNKANKITGVLLFNRKIFLQCLEGSRLAVNDTYNRILLDPRHKEPLLLKYESADRRQFSGWDMGFVPENKLTNPIYLKYSTMDVFDPFQLSGDSADGLLTELSQFIDKDKK